MTPESFNRWRIAPRLLVLLYGLICWLTFEWITGLADPTTQQTAFASTIWGGAAAWFKFYVETGNQK